MSSPASRLESRRSRILAVLVITALAPRVFAQAEPPRVFIKDAKGCQFVNPFDSAEALGQYEWSGECKDGFASGKGTLSYPRTNLSWTGDFVAGEMLQGVMQTTDGTVYEGDFKNNQRHGRGTLRARNGVTLTCAFTGGNSGPGLVIVERPDGFHYEGEYDHANDVIEGRGKLTHPNGGSYEGMWHKGNFEGEGVFKHANGDVRAGTFAAGVLTGSGTITYGNGVKYQGQVKHNEPNGKGRMDYLDGASYEGEFVASEYHGGGVLRYGDGTTLSGQFRAGQAHGLGKRVDQHGNVYEGEFLAGQAHGTGKLVRWDGTVEEGQWKSNLLNGPCTTRTKTLSYRGDCVDGHRWGRGRLEDSRTHQTYEGEFRDNMPYGKGVLEGKDSRYEGDFVAGIKEGRGKETSKQGEYEGDFLAGEYHGKGRLKMVEAGVEILYEGGFAAGQFKGAGVLSFASVRLEGEFEAGDFVRGKIEGGNRKFEIDVAKEIFLEILPDGSKRSIDAEDLSDFGVRS